MQRRFAFFAVALFMVTGSLAQAQSFLNLDPAVPLTLFTTNSNDGYGSGRGVVISVNSSVTVVGVGLFTQPSVNGFTPTWNVWQTTTYPGMVNNILLQTQSPGLQPDVGLDYYDAALTPITLVPGNMYHFEVTYAEAAQQNWFYDADQVNVNLGSVSVLDGTNGGDTGNTVMPGMRLEFAAVPEPTTWALIGLCTVGTGAYTWKKRRNEIRKSFGRLK